MAALAVCQCSSSDSDLREFLLFYFFFFPGRERDLLGNSVCISAVALQLHPEKLIPALAPFRAAWGSPSDRNCDSCLNYSSC